MTRRSPRMPPPGRRWSPRRPRRPPKGRREFDGPPAKGVERLTINYRRVRVSEGPDEVNTRELGRLDRGDEVEVVGSYEGFLQVRRPTA